MMVRGSRVCKKFVATAWLKKKEKENVKFVTPKVK